MLFLSVIFELYVTINSLFSTLNECLSIPFSPSRALPISSGHPNHRKPPLMDIPSTENDACITYPSLLQFVNIIPASATMMYLLVINSISTIN